MSWNSTNDAVLAEGKRVLIDDPQRLDGVTTVVVDEHVRRHALRDDKYGPVRSSLRTRPAFTSSMSSAGPPTASAPPNPSSHYPCSPSAVTDPHSPTETDPHIRQESHISPTLH